MIILLIYYTVFTVDVHLQLLIELILVSAIAIKVVGIRFYNVLIYVI